MTDRSGCRLNMIPRTMFITRPLSVRPLRRGFTLVEMLVVIGIILLLMGILLPAISKAYTAGIRSRMASDLQAIAIALEAYKQDHGDIPRVSVLPTTGTFYESGDSILCRALIGPLNDVSPTVTDSGNLNLGDGQVGAGFRVRPSIAGVPQGKPYGPYLSLDKFKYTMSKTELFIQDRSGVRILYFAGNKTANINITNGFVGYVYAIPSAYKILPAETRPMFNSEDNDMSLFDYGGGSAVNGRKKFQALMGADWGTGAAAVPQITGEYLLWCAGPDGKFGLEELPDANGGTPTNLNGQFQRSKCDDVSQPPR